MNPDDVTVALAAEDYVPVLLTIAAVTLLARGAPTRRPFALLGAVLIAIGGLSKATWKLLVVTLGNDHPILADALFPLLGTGFMLLSWALLRRVPAVVPAVLVVGALGAAVAVGDTWPCLILTILGATALAVALIRHPARTATTTTFAALWLTGQYALGPLAAKANQTLTLQWVEQGANTAAQACLLVAACRLSAPPPAAGRKPNANPQLSDVESTA
jgi:hypothetical protein